MRFWRRSWFSTGPGREYRFKLLLVRIVTPEFLIEGTTRANEIPLFSPRFVSSTSSSSIIVLSASAVIGAIRLFALAISRSWLFKAGYYETYLTSGFVRVIDFDFFKDMSSFIKLA